ncbi:sensor domain-containing diguanylate cyclase [Bradymonas sediminis]|uniref:Uncharacterized protein n=1 Tax=Bradymonas sediminis TaxID=1548548 RepID=A0A2Z4FPY7_9DELT|nr:GGDEF domain-containing protein [Bradymonas sediminis]AWV91023.1 hypothetical protein DN745_17485 [Bradymonas sediminis]TDP75235.1 diguanylate cyclase (GGDEF)-like protein [Bradymonas sediminis]
MDIRTLLICFFAVLSLQAIVLFVAHRNRQARDGTGWMALAFGALGLASGLFMLRDILPDFLTIIVSNTLFASGLALMHRGVSEFVGLGRRHLVMHLFVLSGVLAGVTYFTYGDYDTPMRIVTVSLAYFVEAGLSALLLVRSTSVTRDEERFLGAMFGVLAIANALRAGLTLRYGSSPDFMQSGLIQSLSFLVFIVTCTAIGFFFVWMSVARRHVMLHRQATRDPLTGLLNRRGFLSLAPARMRAAQQEGREVLLLFADIDGLKQVNDTFGHGAGDNIICEAADVLREVLRASDSVARLGGDEFCALMPVRAIEDGPLILRRIEDQVALQNASAGREYILSISAATAAVSPLETRPLEDLLGEADRKMYATKRRRKSPASLNVAG